MIRAVVQNGVIQPLEPLPSNWINGREVVVGELADQPSNGVGVSDTWAQEMNALTATLNDPRECADLEAILAEADRRVFLVDPKGC